MYGIPAGEVLIGTFLGRCRPDLQTKICTFQTWPLESIPVCVKSMPFLEFLTKIITIYTHFLTKTAKKITLCCRTYISVAYITPPPPPPNRKALPSQIHTTLFRIILNKNFKNRNCRINVVLYLQVHLALLLLERHVFTGRILVELGIFCLLWNNRSAKFKVAGS